MTFALVAVSAGAEWRAVRARLTPEAVHESPFGEWFSELVSGRPVVFFQGGWGKISAAASTQYFLDRFSPRVLINLGTCGGFEGRIERGEVILADQTLVYDIIEQMDPDPDTAIRFYATDLRLDEWLRPPYPQVVRRGLLISADRDICPADIPRLVERYQAVAADWESGAIAWVARRNHARCLILRAVSDLVGGTGGEAYGSPLVFTEGACRVMEILLQALPGWLDCIGDDSVSPVDKILG